MSEYYYVHHGAKLTLTVNAHHPDEALNALNVRAHDEGWPSSGWTLEPKPPTNTSSSFVNESDYFRIVLDHTS